MFGADEVAHDCELRDLIGVIILVVFHDRERSYGFIFKPQKTAWQFQIALCRIGHIPWRPTPSLKLRTAS